MRIQTLKKAVIISAAVVGLMVPLTACVGGQPASTHEKIAVKTVPVSSAANECERVDAPMLDIPSAADDEPQLRIPQPAGWEPTSELDHIDKSLRFAMAAGPLDRSENLAMVTLEPLPNLDTETIFDDYRAQLMDMLAAKDLPMNMEAAPTTVCGLPAETLTITKRAIGMGGALNGQRGNPATQLVVVAKVGGQTYLATLVTGAASESPKLRRDIATILAGFEVLPPAASQRL